MVQNWTYSVAAPTVPSPPVMGASVVQSLQVKESFLPVLSVPVQVLVTGEPPVSSTLIGTSGPVVTIDALFVKTFGLSRRYQGPTSTIRSMAFTVLDDSHARQVPPSWAASTAS